MSRMRCISVEGTSDAESGERLLVIMLPGAYSKPEDFLQHGFVSALHEHHANADVLLPDAHIGYYTDGSLVERLAADIVAPARLAGHRRIWLVGISLGGLGALSYTRTHENEIDALVTIAPYPGERGVWVPIQKAGGLPGWTALADANPTDDPGDDPELAVWHWLRDFAAGEKKQRLIMGYGRDDRFAEAQALMSEAVAPRFRVLRDGGHDWPVWQTIWRDTLANELLQRRTVDTSHVG